MNHRKQGLKALGLSLLAVLGLMAFTATAAQGSGKVLVSGLTAPFTVGITGEEDTATTNDRFWVLGLSWELSCPEVSVFAGLLTSAGHGSMTIKFEGCKAQGVSAAGALLGASCSPNPNFFDIKVLILTILHSGNAALATAQHGTGKGHPYLLFTPQDGLTFATMTNSNEECPPPESWTMKGCFVAKLSTTGDQVTHLIDTREMLALFGCSLNYGANAIHLDLDMLVRLTNSVHGNHLGRTWGVESSELVQPPSGEVLVEGLPAPFTVGITGEADSATANDRLWVLGLNLELSCPELSVTNGLSTSAGHGSATVKFEICKAQGVNAAGALVGASCVPNPSFVNANVLALIILHSGSSALTTAQHGSGTGDPYVLFTPSDGLTFATVTNSNEECLLPELATVKGCVVAKLVTSGDRVEQLIDTRGTASLFGCTLKYGANTAHIEADALLRLTNSIHGNHLGLKWGVE